METQPVSQPEAHPAAAPHDVSAEAQHDARAEAQSARPAYAAFAASAAGADDSLLDLTSVAPPAPPPAADDFELDIDFDEPPPRDERRAWQPAQSATDAAGAFAEAAHGVSAGMARAEESAAPEVRDEQTEVESVSAPRGFVEPQVVPSEEPVRMDEDLSVEGDVARAPVAAQAAEVSDAPAEVSATHAAPQTDAQQLSPEMIETIARRAVELLSERVVREVAWEVVPELAERLIRQKLDEQR
jgi:hypothetical protein